MKPRLSVVHNWQPQDREINLPNICYLSPFTRIFRADGEETDAERNDAVADERSNALRNSAYPVRKKDSRFSKFVTLTSGVVSAGNLCVREHGEARVSATSLSGQWVVRPTLE